MNFKLVILFALYIFSVYNKVLYFLSVVATTKSSLGIFCAFLCPVCGGNIRQVCLTALLPKKYEIRLCNLKDSFGLFRTYSNLYSGQDRNYAGRYHVFPIKALCRHRARVLLFCVVLSVYKFSSRDFSS